MPNENKTNNSSTIEMEPINTNNITLDTLSLPEVKAAKINLQVLRLDKIHPLISGNKWYKLRYYLQAALKEQKSILTFGGAWSNHIAATAAACKMFGLNAIGIIRGEEPAHYSATLQAAAACGMQLHFIPRAQYAAKEIPSSINTNAVYHIPEGGYGEMGVRGAATLVEGLCLTPYTHFCCASGTGTMAAGIVRVINSKQKLLAFSVLKGHHSLLKNIKELSRMEADNIMLDEGFHFGGYAKINNVLIDFMNQFYAQTSIPSDFVYTAKLFYGILARIQAGYFPEGSNILAIHSGGLQGNQSFEKGTLIF